MISRIVALACTFQLAIAHDDNADEAAGVFSDTFISDLGPLLALFGEQVTKQFMSQSMGWSEHVIFAMAPLGTITAIVSAIRVGGPNWMKATIGRARESRGIVEVELMSSTSHDVCELWNGSQIVRVMGFAPIKQILLLRKLTRFPSKPRDMENQPMKTSDSPSTSLIATPYAPNISINLDNRLSDWWLWAAALFAVMLQGAVLVTEAIVTYYPGLQRTNTESPLPNSSALAVTIAGTVCLIIGMLLCSYIVERSTTETYWRTPNGEPFRLFWVQQGQTVNDQNFDSFLLFARGERTSLMTSHPAGASYNESENADHNNHTSASIEILVLLATFTSILGFLAYAIGLRSMHWSATVAQLGATLVMTVVRALVRLDLAQRPFAQRLPKGFELDWLA
ncbi:hypothetical protein BDZ91DRAFT_831923, partial [Kalaharituber pfeilii]